MTLTSRAPSCRWKTAARNALRSEALPGGYLEFDNPTDTQNRLAIGIRIAAIPRSDEVKAWRNTDGADSCPFKSKKNAAWIKGTITIVTTHKISTAKDANTTPMAPR